MLRRRFVLGMLCAWSMTQVAYGFETRIAPSVIEHLAAGERQRVLVALRPPDVSLRAPGGVQRRCREITKLQADVTARAMESVDPSDIVIEDRFATASGFIASVSPAGLAALAAQPDVVRIESVPKGSAALAHSVPQINADIVRALGVTGRGVTVAVLDTAIDTSHPDLVSQIVDEECFCSSGCCPGGRKRLSGSGSATGTAVAHGTHVTGIIVSQGSHHIADIGVAPGAQVVAVRVLNDQEQGNLGDWIAALDWLAVYRPDVRVVNMSLASTDIYPPGCESLSAANEMFGEVIDTLRAQGTIVFAAAGNNADATKLAAPACVAHAIAVGAVDSSDVIAPFSNSSPTLALLAPGVAIRSTAPNASTAVLSGTSMATPHAAGVAALLWSAEGDLTPDQVEQTLSRTGVPILDPRNGQIFPRVDALAAYKELLSVGSLVTGGGSRRNDCLVEWSISPRTIVRSRTRPVAMCHDGDPSCDHDTIAGQCTFHLSLCFNVPDGRLPYCRADDPITRVTLEAPRPNASDPADASNAAAALAALPPPPVTGEKVCTAEIPVVVPLGPRGRGARVLDISAETVDRRDRDHARFFCLAP
jgi:Subtilase family